jgi:hypothetical protein
MIAQRVTDILGAHAAPPLKLRHDLGHEPLDGTWAIYRGQHEAISSDGIDEGLHLIRNATGSANELRQPDALAVSHSDLTDSHESQGSTPLGRGCVICPCNGFGC